MVGTGEHGVGIGKRKYLVEELGEGTVRLMKTIKDSIDPLNLFNPGKVSLSLLLRIPLCADRDGSSIQSCLQNQKRPESTARRRYRGNFGAVVSSILCPLEGSAQNGYQMD